MKAYWEHGIPLQWPTGPVSPDWGVSMHLRRRRQWHPTPVLLPGKSHGRRGLVSCSPWGCYSRTRLSDFFHFSFSCIGEGNGNPLQCSCLENPRDGEAWWAAVYGVVQGRTRLKRLSSSSSRHLRHSVLKLSDTQANPLNARHQARCSRK